jgi:tetratricopeptide (TPR) repeat protein
MGDLEAGQREMKHVNSQFPRLQIPSQARSFLTFGSWPRWELGLVIALLLLALGCSSSDRPSASPPQRKILEVTLPDLSRMDPSVQEQVRQGYQSMLDIVKKPGATDEERGRAYGNVGMLLQAGEYYDAAEPAYLNAQALMPQEPRWPYFLAHLYKSEGNTAKSIELFNRVLEISPNDVPTMIWLGRGYLDQGQADKAKPLFERARQLAPQVPSVLVGLGQAALARRDFARAASTLEEALKIDPSLQSVHSPLAMAYRGLGDAAKAEEHLKLWKNTEVLVPDPFRQELDLALESGLSYELRGVRSLEARDFKAAAEFFKKGVEITPGSSALGRSLRHKLATALYLDGDVRGAVKWFEETLRMAPDNGIDETAAKAHYSLGVLMASSGRSQDAINHLSAAVRFSPNYVEAYQALADALRRSGRVEQSLAQYAEALRVNPKAGDARFGYGMALVRLGRYREARDWFDEASRIHPDRQDFPFALARLLAAAPDDRVRDGQRAQAIVEHLSQTSKTIDLGETMAMALAERGEFADAIAIQRQVMEASIRSGLESATKRMAANLLRYERRQPCRMPWASDEPIHSPGPPVDPGLLASTSAAAAP